MCPSHLLLGRIVTLALLLSAGGCALFPPPKPKPPVPEPPAKKSHWNGEAAAAPGAPAILINLSEQRAHFFKGPKEVGQSLISSGKKGFATLTGDFKITQRDKSHVSNLYGDFVDEAGEVVQGNVDVTKDKPPEGASFRGAKMPFFMRFHGGTGMHAGKLPGYPASHGCVRMPRFMAEHFFTNAPLGTPVTVTGSAPARRTASGPAKKAPAGPAKPAPPGEPAPPAPAPESVPKVDAEPEKKPEPAAPADAPPGS